MAPRKNKQTGRERFRNFRRSLRKDSPEGKTARIWLGALIVVFGLLTAVMINAPWAGGWEITSSLDSVYIEGEKFITTGLHEFSYDVDGSWTDWVADNDPPAPYNKYYDYDLGKLSEPKDYGLPEIEISTSYPYYINRLDDGSWVKTDNPEPLDEYELTVSTNPLIVQTYNHWTIGIDVTIETEAEKYYKPQFPYVFDYGWFYEASVAEVDVWLDCSITPWTPVGANENWTVTGGWSGIMSASVFDYSYGRIQGDVTENYGHTIQGLEQIGQALNMDVQTISFDDPTAIAGVPTSLSAEVNIDLGAGAYYTSDWLGYWTMVTVRNVYVEYNVRFDIVTTLIWELNLGHQEGMESPDEDNTGYEPEITPWKQLMDGLNEFIKGPTFQIIMIAIVIVSGIVLYGLLKGRGL